MTLSVRNQLIQDSQGRYKYWTPSGGTDEHYQMWISIDGSTEELESIRHVNYELPSTFQKPLRGSLDRSTNFRVMIWVSGSFPIQIRIQFKDGRTQEIGYLLSYVLPDDTGSNYVQVRDIS